MAEALALQPLRAVAVLDDAVADRLPTLARIEDQRRAAAEPEPAVGVRFAVEGHGLTLMDDGDDLGAEGAVGTNAARRTHAEDIKGGAALLRLLDHVAVLVVTGNIGQKPELGIDA
jgi:hypothetical protein